MNFQMNDSDTKNPISERQRADEHIIMCANFTTEQNSFLNERNLHVRMNFVRIKLIFIAERNSTGQNSMSQTADLAFVHC